MESIAQLSKKYGFHVVEDASHAIGGRYKNTEIGSCQYSDVTIFSFHPVKTMTTGEGGLAATNNKRLAEKMTLLRTHGITRDPDLMTHISDGPWYYQQIDLGFNYRLTDIQAALGISQLKRLKQFVERRHEIAALYDELLTDLPVNSQLQEKDCYSGMHLYVIRLLTGQINKTHRQVFEAMREAGISVNLHYIPVHLQPYFQAMGFKLGDFPEAERYYQDAITLPMFPALTAIEVKQVVTTLREIIS